MSSGWQVVTTPQGLLGDLLEDVTDGVASALELQWRRKVELAHGLPRGARNQAERLHGRRTYRDLRYDRLLWWPSSTVVLRTPRSGPFETGSATTPRPVSSTLRCATAGGR